MIIFLQEFIMQLFLWMLQLIDGIMEIFSAISGITNVSYQGESVNIIEYLAGDSTVGTIFWCIFILAIGLAGIFTIASLVKNMIVNNKNTSTIVGKFFLSLLGTMAMVAVVILGILISNAVLQLVSRIFQIENTTKLSNQIFNACVGDWLNGYSVKEINVTSMSVREIFGDYDTLIFMFPTEWKMNGIVNPNTFMYFPSMVVGIGLIIALIGAIINLAKRVYEIIFLYIIMPVSMATLSLDDGARFKIWRETFITKMLLAYGTVFSVNIFILLLPIISKMRIAGISDFGNTMFLVFMIIGGAMVIPAGQALFAKLFGNGDDMHAGGNFMHSAFYGARLAGMLTVGAATKFIKGSYKIGKGIHDSRHKKNDSDRFSDDKGDKGGNASNNVEGMEDTNDEEN